MIVQKKLTKSLLRLLKLTRIFSKAPKTNKSRSMVSTASSMNLIRKLMKCSNQEKSKLKKANQTKRWKFKMRRVKKMNIMEFSIQNRVTMKV